MSNFVKTQQGIKGLSPGEFQRLCSDYYSKYYNITDIHDFGSKEGTNKTTKGVPDSYIRNSNGKYTLLMYGTVDRDCKSKIAKDILDAYNPKKTGIEKDKIEKIVCFHICTNLSPGDMEYILNLCDDVKIELIDIDTMAHAIKEKFNSLAVEYFQLPVDTNQISDIEDFIKKYDKYSINSPLDLTFVERKEKNEIIEKINESKLLTLVTGKAGVGKTKIVLEVCKELSKDYNCLCIRSNNNEIYEDIKNKIEKDGKYLIFVDDINNLHNIKSFIDLIATSDKEIKIVSTIREYVLHNVLMKVTEYTSPEIYKLKELSDNDIIEILKINFNILNPNWHKNIIKLANGNPRIAVMTATALLDGKVKSFNSVTEVFKKYYDNIILQNQLGNIEIKILFYLSLLSPLSTSNVEVKKLLEKNEIFSIALFEKLRDLELIDYYNEEAIRVCDQNFSNYILYKYLIELKKISLSDLLQELYPNFMKKFIECINMICEIFNSNETYDYIKNEINLLWDEKYSNNDDFLKSFHNLNIPKTLSILTKKIDVINPEKLNKIEFNDNVSINDNIIEILSDIKDSNYYQFSFKLLLLYFEKKPSIYNQLEKVITDWWIFYDENPNYEMQLYVIDQLFQLSDNYKYKDIIVRILNKSIIKALKTHYDITRQVKDFRSIEIGHIILNDSTELRNYRKQILGILVNLINKDTSFLDMLTDYSIWPLSDKQEQLLVNDLHYLDINLFSNWHVPTLEQWIVIDFIKSNCNKNHIQLPDNIKNIKENEKHELLKLIMNYDDEQDSNYEIKNIIINKETEKILRIFQLLNEIKILKTKLNDWKINNNICFMMNKAKEIDIIYFEKIFNLYIENGCPYISYPKFLLTIEDQDLKKRIIKSISESNVENKFYMLSFLLESYEVDPDYLELIKSFISSQDSYSRKYSLNIDTIIKYNVLDSSLLKTYTEDVLNSNDLNICSHYMCFDASYENVKKLYNLFKNKDDLETLYLKILPCTADHEGYLGYLLIKNNCSFINKILKNNNYHSNRLDNIVNYLWNDKDYKELIKKVFYEINSQPLGYFDLEHLFKFHNHRIVVEWIKEYILENINDIEKIKHIFRVVGTFDEESRKEIILLLLTSSNDNHILEKINLFPMSESWSGSRLPIMDKKISFLKDLQNDINNLNDIKSLYSLEYLEKYINDIRNYRRKVEIQEYLDDFIN